MENIQQNPNNHKSRKLIFIVISLACLFASIFPYLNFSKPIEGKEIENDTKFIFNTTLRDMLQEQNKLKKKFLELLKMSGIDENYSSKEVSDAIYRWKNKYYPYSGIERFAIPVISTISAGKSSFFNFFLNLMNNILQIGEKITTKFCVIIRHNKYEKRGRIYNVTIEKREDINKYNFHKGEEIKMDIKQFIEERNKLIEKLQNERKKGTETKDFILYFIILERDTGLFEGEYEAYSQLVEFIDIPGLNEFGEGNKFYFNDVLPFIKLNILFPIILLDAEKFHSTDVFKVFNEIFKPHLTKYIEKNYL